MECGAERLDGRLRIRQTDHDRGGWNRSKAERTAPLKACVLTALLAGVVLTGTPAQAAPWDSYGPANEANKNTLAHEMWQDSQIKDLKQGQQDVSGLKGTVNDLKDDFDKSKEKDHKQDLAIGDLKDDVSELKQGQQDVSDLKDQFEQSKEKDQKQDAAIGGLKGDVSDLKGDVSDLKDDFDKSKEKDQKQDAAIGGLKGDVSDLKGDVGDLKEDFDKSKEKDHKQDAAIAGSIAHDAIQDGAIIGGMIKDGEQDSRLDVVEEVNQDQQSQIDDVRGEIGTEQAERVEADQKLQDQIDDHDSRLDVVEEVNKDQQSQIDDVRGEIGTEQAERVEADQKLQDQIDNHDSRLDVVEEVNQDQQSQIDDVRGEIGTEQAERVEADQKLQDQIDDHDSRLDVVEEVNKDQQSQIDDVRGEIGTEQAERVEADQKLQDQIDNHDSRLDVVEEVNQDQQSQIDDVRGEIGTEQAERVEADQNLQNNIDAVDDKVGDLNYGSHDYVDVGDDTTTAIGKLDDALGDVEYKAQQHTSVTISDSNIHLTASTNASGGTNYDISLSKNPNFNSVTAGGVTINKDGSGTIGGLQNTTWNGEHYTHGQAATEDQLHQAIQTNVGDLNYGDHLNYVTNGESTTTSIGKLDDNLGRVENQVNANTSAISGLNSRVDTLDGRIDKVGANAAALAALHPMDFDPDDKWDFAAGVGNYGGENAMAVGAFYRPNEDTMVSVGGSFGTGENMVNAGVSFKIGQGNHVSTSRVAMAKEIETLRHNVAQLTELVNALVGEKQQVQTAETTPFPDVPENHWAYETVKKMADRGLIEGYPDGTFGGDRQMTRYEFATIVYRALQQGLGMNEDIQRLAEEFKPELALIRVDTVATDSEGNPTIERVRVNKA